MERRFAAESLIEGTSVPQMVQRLFEKRVKLMEGKAKRRKKEPLCTSSPSFSWKEDHLVEEAWLEKVITPIRETNEQFLHEVLLDPSFQISKDGLNGVFMRKRYEALMEDFWNEAKEPAESATPNYSRICFMLEDIKHRLLECTPSGLEVDVNEALDMDFIKEQSRAGRYGWDQWCKVMEAVFKLVQRVVVPECLEATKEKWHERVCKMQEAAGAPEQQPRALCDVLRFLMECVEKTIVDQLNLKIRHSIAAMHEEAIEFEHSLFEKKAVDGTYTLETTRQWIHRTIQSEMAVDDEFAQHLAEGMAPAFSLVHAAAMLDMVVTDGFEPHRLPLVLCPETLALDTQHLERLRFEFLEQNQALALLAGALVVDLPDKKNKEAFDMILGLMKQDSIIWCPTLKVIAEEVKAQNLTTHPELLMQAFRRCVNPNALVYKIATDSLKTMWWKRLVQCVQEQERCKVAMEAIMPRINKAAAKLKRIMDINWKVHAPTYNQLIHERLSSGW